MAGLNSIKVVVECFHIVVLALLKDLNSKTTPLSAMIDN